MARPSWPEIVRRHADASGAARLPLHVVDELSAHLEDLYQAARAQGASEPVAIERAMTALRESPLDSLLGPRRRARPPAPPVTGFHQTSPLRSLSMRHAFRLAMRQFTRHKAFAFVTVLVLGLSTGASVAVYTVVDAVLLRPLPYTAPDQLVTLWDTNPGRGLAHEPMSPVTFMDYRELDAFADAAGWWRPDINLTDPGLDPVRVRAIETSANLFSLLGVSPQVGPGFAAGGPFFDRNRIAVISDRLWRTRYQADAGLIGKQLALSGVPYTIVGVMPPRFHFPDDVDVWLRLQWDFHQHSRQAHFLESIARLAPGVDVAQARVQVKTLGERLARDFAASNAAWSVRLVPLVEEQLGYYRAALIVLFGAVGLLMVIGCLNVASLLLTRALSREREVAVRTALGAAPRHLIVQLLAEATVLSIAGALVGVIAAAIAIPAIVAASPVNIPRLDEAAINVRVLGFAVAIATGATLLFGLVPALVLIRRRLTADLKISERGASRVSRTLYQGLVVGEVALACALLISSGLLVRTVGRMTSVPTGVHTPHAVTTRIQLSGQAYTDWSTVANVHGAILDGVRARPGVRAAGAANFLPFEVGWRMPLVLEGETAAAGEQVQAQNQSVTDGYFEAIGATRMAGRFFTPQDHSSAAPVVVVNETLARRFPGPIVGRYLVSTSRGIGPLGWNLMMPPLPPVPPGATRGPVPPTPIRFEIVGVVADVRNVPIAQPVEAAVYYSARQYPFRAMFLTVLGPDLPSSVAAMQAGLRQAAPGIPLGETTTLVDRFRSIAAEPRLLMTLLVFFAVLAAVLAALGVYGLFSWSVALRRRELAIRLTLGARPASVGAVVLRQGALLICVGLVAGWVVVRLAERLLVRVLFDVSPGDISSTALAAGLLLTASVLACVPPAIRAMRVDPVEGLRVE
ncbi:MAG TPA: ABC transporter permease [Vicinamibacterales bacterium]|nr:ABC transporter permease [Vicinamibacterales bacterium]